MISYCKAKKLKMHGAMLKEHAFKVALTHCYCASFLGTAGNSSCNVTRQHTCTVHVYRRRTQRNKHIKQVIVQTDLISKTSRVIDHFLERKGRGNVYRYSLTSW